MGIFDALTGAPARTAANQQRSYLEGVQRTGNAQLDNALQDAMRYTTEGTAGARSALTGGYDTARGAVGTGADQALNYLNQGVTGAQGALQGASAAYSPLTALAQKYGGGTSLYMDALGANGPEGAARAKAAFEPSGAYNFTMDQGIEALTRAANARGGGAGFGGNTDRDAQNYAAGLASKEYGGWLDRLGGLVSPELAATSGAATGRANVAGREADLLYGAGGARANIATGEAGRLADLATGYGQNTANLERGQGLTLADLARGNAQSKVGLATNIAPQYSQTYGQEAAAQMQASGNTLNLGMNIASMAMGLPPVGNVFGGGGGGGGQQSGGQQQPYSFSNSPIGQFGSWLGGLGGGGSSVALGV